MLPTHNNPEYRPAGARHSRLGRMMFIDIPSSAIAVAEGLVAACAVIAAIPMQLAVTPSWHPNVAKTQMVALLILIAILFLMRDTRRGNTAQSPLDFITGIGLRCGIAVTAVAALVHELADVPPVPTTFYLLAGIYAWAAVVIVRCVTPFLRRSAKRLSRAYERRVMVVTDRTCAEMVEFLGSVNSSARVASVRYLSADPTERSAFLAQLTREVDPGSQDEIWLAVAWSAWTDIAAAMESLADVPLPVRILPDQAAQRILGHRREECGGVPTFELRSVAIPILGRAAKRLTDAIGALVGLILLAPLLVATAIAIRIDSPGPIFFRQSRGGRYNQTFRIWKFRTMRVADDGPSVIQATRGDARITGIGTWLRCSSIDELPQLLNVLVGEMSLIGPRPHAVAHDTEYARLIQQYSRRYHVKPGLTGWAQINGSRGETPKISDMTQRIDFDIWYTSNWSMWLDFKIIVKTMILSSARKSAY